MKKIILFLLFIPCWVQAQKYSLKLIAEAKNASYRGLDILNDQTIWLSGSKGHIAKSLLGTNNWQWVNPSAYQKLDFRAIKALNSQTAVAVNAGSPAYILKTVDGGKNWVETYKNIDSAIFLDGLSFWDQQQGLIFGDPINGQLQLLKTIDGGDSWQNISAKLNFKMASGEASFAASNSTMKTLAGGLVWIATGGKVSNIYFSADYGETWKRYSCPILQGLPSTGVFSIDFLDKNIGVAVGGDYLKPTENTNNVLLTKDGGKTWHKALKPVLGYRSAVCYINKNTLVATGISGTDVSTDGGNTWLNISSQSFNTIQKNANGSVIILAGDKGSIYQLTIE